MARTALVQHASGTTDMLEADVDPVGDDGSFDGLEISSDAGAGPVRSDATVAANRDRCASQPFDGYAVSLGAVDVGWSNAIAGTALAGA